MKRLLSFFNKSFFILVILFISFFTGVVIKVPSSHADSTPDSELNILQTVGTVILPQKLQVENDGIKMQVFYPKLSYSDPNYYALNFNPQLITPDTRIVEAAFFLNGDPSKVKGDFKICLQSDKAQCTEGGKDDDDLHDVAIGKTGGPNPSHPLEDGKLLTEYRKYKYPDMPNADVIRMTVCGNGDDALKFDCDYKNQSREVWFHAGSTYRIGLYQITDNKRVNLIGEINFSVKRYYPNVYLNFGTPEEKLFDKKPYLVGESYKPVFAKSGENITQIGGTYTTWEAQNYYVELRDVPDYLTFKCLKADKGVEYAEEEQNLVPCTPKQIANKEGLIIKEIPSPNTSDHKLFRVDVTLTGRVIPMSADNNGKNYNISKDKNSDDENDYQISFETKRGTELDDSVKDQCIVVRGNTWDIKYNDIKQSLYRYKERTYNLLETGRNSTDYKLPSDDPNFPDKKGSDVQDSQPAVFQGLDSGTYSIDVSEQDNENRDSCSDDFTYWRIPLTIKHIKKVDGTWVQRLTIYENEIEKDPNEEDFAPNDSGSITSPCAHENEDGHCDQVKTAFGTVSPQPALFIKDFFTVVLAIASAGAIFMLILSGYQFVTSQGDKQKLAGARETITSTIVGLLFIIFSLVILEFIGVDILQLPGLGAGKSSSNTTSTPGSTSNTPAFNCGDKNCNFNSEVCRAKDDIVTNKTLYFCEKLQSFNCGTINCNANQTCKLQDDPLNAVPAQYVCVDK